MMKAHLELDNRMDLRRTVATTDAAGRRTIKASLRRRSLLLHATIPAWLLAAATPAQAQTGQADAGQTRQAQSAVSPAPQGVEDIIVTARKREETSLSVPVAISAVSAVELERRQITTVDALASVVPQLIVGEAGGSPQGGIVSLRGIGSGETNPLIDQAVAFNIDGVAIAKSTARRLSEFDLQQIEVLRGPQTLFFGKNSPGGIISLRTADPTSRLEGKVAVGYEVNASEKQLQGYISGPLSDQVGVRVAFFADQANGWVHDTTPPSNPLAPKYDRLPRGREFGGRLTLVYQGDRLKLRAKLSGDSRVGAGPHANTQIVACPVGGVIQGTGTGDCIANDQQAHGDLGQAYLTSQTTGVPYTAALIGDSVPSMYVGQALASLEANYKLNDTLTLTSVSGYYGARINYSENFNYSNDAAKSVLNSTLYTDREVSQEVRLASDFHSAFNFTIGGLYGNASARARLTSLSNATTPAFLNYFDFIQATESWSVFAQGRLDILPTLELSGGGRYSHERKRLDRVDLGINRTPSAPAVTSLSWNNFSPEATLTWRPSSRLTAFASYRTGFLSGGFNNGTTVAGVTPYDQQKIKGFEVGLKSLALGGNLRTNLVFYDYNVKGLAITTSVNAVATTVNAGEVKLHGIEFDFDYKVPGVRGLSLRGAAAWEHARYAVYSVGCWPGQRPDQGCNQGLNAAGTAYTIQNLAGTQLLRAPDWSGRLGLGYATTVSPSLKAEFFADANYSSSYVTDAQSIPFAKQNDFAKVDLTATLSGTDGRWELALIGRNMTNQYTYIRSVPVIFTGSGTGTAAAVPPDVAAPIGRGREVWVRFTWKFGQ